MTIELSMDTATPFMAIVGFLSGLYALWLSHVATRQDLTIARIDADQMKFRVINFSLRPIPVQEIYLELSDNGKFTRSDETPTLDGISLPGPLPPESSFEVQWELRQLIEMVLSKRYRLTLITQTGKTIRVIGIVKKEKSRPRGVADIGPRGTE